MGKHERKQEEKKEQPTAEDAGEARMAFARGTPELMITHGETDCMCNGLRSQLADFRHLLPYCLKLQ